MNIGLLNYIILTGLLNLNSNLHSNYCSYYFGCLESEGVFTDVCRKDTYPIHAINLETHNAI
jgi:hypothetical protein